METALLSIDIEIDEKLGFIAMPIPFYVGAIVPSKKRHKGPLKSKILVHLIFEMLDLKDCHVYEQPNKTLIVTVSENGSVPTGRFKWIPVLSTPFFSSHAFVYASIV